MHDLPGYWDYNNFHPAGWLSNLLPSHKHNQAPTEVKCLQLHSLQYTSSALQQQERLWLQEALLGWWQEHPYRIWVSCYRITYGCTCAGGGNWISQWYRRIGVWVSHRGHRRSCWRYRPKIWNSRLGFVDGTVTTVGAELSGGILDGVVTGFTIGVVGNPVVAGGSIKSCLIALMGNNSSSPFPKK